MPPSSLVIGEQPAVAAVVDQECRISAAAQGVIDLISELRGQGVTARFHEGVLLLHGHVRKAYHKHLAQERLRQANAVARRQVKTTEEDPDPLNVELVIDNRITFTYVPAPVTDILLLPR